jgi:hypothetical protein
MYPDSNQRVPKLTRGVFLFAKHSHHGSISSGKETTEEPVSTKRKAYCCFSQVTE